MRAPADVERERKGFREQQSADTQTEVTVPTWSTAHTMIHVTRRLTFVKVTRFHESMCSNRFEHLDLPAKLLDYFLRSNKSDMNQMDHVGGYYLPRFSLLLNNHQTAIDLFILRSSVPTHEPCNY